MAISSGGSVRTGATQWDYRIRRMEITWELAQELAVKYRDSQEQNTENYKKALKDAWGILNETIPPASEIT